MSGTNIIGVLPGRYINTPKDRPVIIGAHWDVVANSSGYNDNGSGMAVMLGILRTLTSKDCYKPDYSVIFVAFDLEEPGCFGSLEFVRMFVMPRFVKKGAKIGGVFIVDTVGNIAFQKDSQDVPDSWRDLLPGVAKEIDRNDRKGDFIAAVGRANNKDYELMDMLQVRTVTNYETDDICRLPSIYFLHINFFSQSHFRPGIFRFQRFGLNTLPAKGLPSKEQLTEHAYFWQSDNSRFWFYHENGEHFDFPAVLLTDTGKQELVTLCTKAIRTSISRFLE